MKFIYFVWVLGLLSMTSPLAGQNVPFTGTWSFEGNSNGSSSNGLISVSAASFTGVNLLAINPYTAGYAGLGANIQNWSTTLCNNTEYVEFSVQPTGMATVTLSTLSFAFARSSSGPQQLSVRSSADGFSSDIYAQATSTSFQNPTIVLTGPGFTNQASTIRFRIYACNPTAGGGTIRLDEIQINGASLPVTLVSFAVKPLGNSVQLAWSTTAERDADRFDIQRSPDVREFATVGQVMAKGTTDQQQYYGFVDEYPPGGTSYYRLKLVDQDGRVNYSKILAVVLDEVTPALALLGNPLVGEEIHVAVRNLANARYSLTTLAGQELSITPRSQADGSWRIFPEQPLRPGVYVLEAVQGEIRLQQKVVVR